jgi:hypothetical protein
MLVKRSINHCFEVRGGAQIDLAADAYDGDTFAVSDGGREWVRS